MKRLSTTLLAGIAFCALPAMAYAHTILIDNIVGEWVGGVPPANVTTSGGGTANPKARWGVPAVNNGGQSGYDFDAVASVSATIPPSPTATFILGTFQHLNFPINSGTSITGIQLKVTTDVSVDSGPDQTLSFLFDFDHDETTNGAVPCAYGNSNPGDPGVNVNGCADRVKISYNALSQGFTVGSDTYTLNLRGFEVGSTQVSQFLTKENEANVADLVGVFELRSVAINPTGVVPEPTTLAVLGMGLLGLTAARRRRG